MNKGSFFNGKLFVLIVILLQTVFLSAQVNNIPNLKHLTKKFKSIEVDSNYQNGNWKPLFKKLKNKRIVLLGELNHGSRELFLSRNDLITTLHQELGFDVILFESGIGELIATNLQKEHLKPKQMLNGLIGSWRTSEFEELMAYVKAHNLSISGFDVQRSGSSFKNVLAKELKRIGIYNDKFEKIEDRFTEEKRKLTNRKAVYDSIRISTDALVEDYTELKLSIEKLESTVLTLDSHFVLRTIQNRITYLQYFLSFVKEQDWNKRWKERDFMMYLNIDWLLNTIYKNQKVIVIAHNYHISKFNEKQDVLGEFLCEKYRSQMYAIGVFAGRGSFSNNRGLEEKLKPISNDGLDIKQIIAALDRRVSFLNIPSKKKKDFEWLFNEIIINDTFIDLYGSNKMILSKSFDGLICIDQISLPKKL